MIIKLIHFKDLKGGVVYYAEEQEGILHIQIYCKT